MRVDSTEKAAVIGMGYVGIPLACTLAKSGVRVFGIDINKERVNSINRGKNPLRGDEPGLQDLLAEVVDEGMLKAASNYSACRNSKVVFISVDTPIDEKKRPIFDHLLSAIEGVSENLSKGTLVVIESTIAPGTMRDVIRPNIEKISGLRAGKDFFLAHCPERVMSGKLLFNLVNLDRILGGLDKKSTEIAMHWYKKFLKGKLLETDMTTAEVVKTAENAYRDVQIAFANEIALICENLGLDAFEVRRLVNSSPFRDMHLPGAGVGGHCLPKDPWLLVYGGREAKPKLIPTARRLNDFMPEHIAELSIEAMREAGIKEGKNTNVVIFGYAFLENSGDTRNSPSKRVVDILKDKFNVLVHDPYVTEAEGAKMIKDLNSALKKADCAIFMTKHRDYSDLSLDDLANHMRHKIVIDGRDLFDKRKAKKLGIIYKGIGKG